MKSKPDAIIFIGLPASGKSYFYNQNFRKTHLHISLDVLGTRPKEKRILEACISMNIPFVIDNTNVSKEKRKVYIDAVKDKYNVIGYYFSSKVNECIDRNAFRDVDDVVPVVAIKSLAKKLEQPEHDEGFDELYFVSIEDSELKVKEWKEKKE